MGRPWRLDEEARFRRQGTHLSVRVGLIDRRRPGGIFYEIASTAVLCKEAVCGFFYISESKRQRVSPANGGQNPFSECSWNKVLSSWKDVYCGMKSEHLVGTSIPRFTYDTPTTPGNDFYALCEGERPLCMIFLPGFDHPVSREYITRYLKTLPALRGVRLACVVRSSAQSVAAATRGSEFPFPVICDEPGVLYSYLGVEQSKGLLSWSFAAQKIYKAAKDAGVDFCARSLGGMMGLFFLPQLPNGFSDVMKADAGVFGKFFHEMLSRGVYLAPSIYEAGFMSAAHTDEDIDATIAAAREAFALL